ncbi:hypothetical protein R1sor_022351 [Riccia sorocarpa]|uniref:Cytochrome P450 n=1 Tax=Riccia sorocarpa TaxID=122646 RepID=A0ABD3GJL2_9MARC
MASMGTYTLPGGRWNSLPLSYTTPIIISVVVTIVVWFIMSYIPTRRRLPLPLPPGSYGLPWIGDTISFMAASMSDVGHQKWIESKRAKYGPFFKIRFMGNPMVMMDAPGGNKFLFQNEGKHMDTYWPPQVPALLGPDSIFMMAGEEHRVARRYLARLLDHTVVSQYFDTVQRRAVQHFAKHWEENETRGSEIFITAALDKTIMFTFSVMCSLLISMDEGPQMDELLSKFSTWSKGFLSLPINLPGFAFYDGFKMRRHIMDFIAGYITQRRAELAEDQVSKTAAVDMLTSLLTVADDKGEMLSEAKIQNTLLTFLYAGFDSSSTALAMTVYYIAKYPHIYDQLVQEHRSILEQKRRKGDDEAFTREDLSAMKITWAVIQETLRLQPPVTGTFRRAKSNLEYNGRYQAADGLKFGCDMQMMWNTMNSHHDPKFFQDPATFNPSRFEEPPSSLTYLPFGGGPRACLGNEFAKMEMLIFIHHLIKRYKWTLVDPEDPVIRDPTPRHQNGTLIKVTKIAL